MSFFRSQPYTQHTDFKDLIRTLFAFGANRTNGNAGSLKNVAWQFTTSELACPVDMAEHNAGRRKYSLKTHALLASFLTTLTTSVRPAMSQKWLIALKPNICLPAVREEAARWARRSAEEFSASAGRTDLRVGSSGNRSIPKILHQMAYVGSRHSGATYDATDWMERIHAKEHGWCVHYWSDAALYAMVAEYYPALLTVYNLLPKGVMRSDVARYLVVALYGGWYADTDIVCRDTLDNLERHENTGLQLLAQPQKRNASKFATLTSGIANFLFGSAAMHPYWDAVVHEVLQLGILGRAGRPVKSRTDVVSRTGPGLLTRAARHAFRKPRPQRLPNISTTAIIPQGPDPELIGVVFSTKNMDRKAWSKRFAGVRTQSKCILCYHLNFFQWNSRTLQNHTVPPPALRKAQQRLSQYDSAYTKTRAAERERHLRKPK